MKEMRTLMMMMMMMMIHFFIHRESRKNPSSLFLGEITRQKSFVSRIFSAVSSLRLSFRRMTTHAGIQRTSPGRRAPTRQKMTRKFSLPSNCLHV
jgi:hypothetical protein